ncbi:MAG: prephenate dehydratase, partial [Candidatus Omnitrophica bacterium]|nr:prephenate dehydratase [Candidatus Omnitrophota bacterium]
MLTVAYLGPEHTNTHLAAQAKFGRRANYVHAPTVDDVFHMVERQQADHGVVPVENSLEGAVTHTLDRFIDFQHSPVQIQGEMEQQIQHHLIVHLRTKNVSRLKEVYSHPQALAQCRHWLDKNLPHVHRRETNSTAEAVNAILNPLVMTSISTSIFGGPTKTT